MKYALLFLLGFTAVADAATPQEQALRPYTPPPAPEVKAWPRERVLVFMRELADFVHKNHVVTDPERKTYGMVYECWKDGKKMQEFGSEAMQDGARWMSALVTAQRADLKGDWLGRAQKFQVPFYANLLNRSDEIFLKMRPAEDDKHPWHNPVKGWAPRGWDDGSGFDRRSGKLMPDGYSTGSNQLAQDLADALLNVWLSTRDPQVSEALGHLRDYKQQCFGGLQGVDIAAATSAGQANAFLKYRFPDFSVLSLTPYYTGLFKKDGSRLPSYDDALGWRYREGTAAALIAGEMPRGLTTYLLGRAYGAHAAMEVFFDDRAAQYGAWFQELPRSPGFADGQGKLDTYSSTSKVLYSSRGIQFAAITAAVLPELRAEPRLWENTARKFAADVRVSMTDSAPVTDGIKDNVYVKASALGEDSARVTLVSDPRNLHIYIETSRPQLTVTFQEEYGPTKLAEMRMHPRSAERRLAAKTKSKSSSAAKKKGKGAVKKSQAKAKEKQEAAPPEPLFSRGGKLLVTKEGTSTITNEKGESLLAQVAFRPAGEFKQGEGDLWMVEVRIPYTFVPGQNAWINGADFGRYRVGIDTAPQQTVCVLSDAARVQRRLEQGVLGTIDFWNSVWKQAGFIPGVWDSPNAKAGSQAMSDAGGYAHLLNTMALWLIYQDGHREWELIREQFPTTPIPAAALPAAVLKAQGL